MAGPQLPPGDEQLVDRLDELKQGHVRDEGAIVSIRLFDDDLGAFFQDDLRRGRVVEEGRDEAERGLLRGAVVVRDGVHDARVLDHDALALRSYDLERVVSGRGGWRAV